MQEAAALLQQRVREKLGEECVNQFEESQETAPAAAEVDVGGSSVIEAEVDIQVENEVQVVGLGRASA